MAVDAGRCRWAPQEPAPGVPTQRCRAPAVHAPDCLPACQPACLPACLPGCRRPPPRAPGGWRKRPKRTPARRCGASHGLRRSRDSCRLLQAWLHARLRLHPAPHRTAPHRTTSGRSLGRGWKRAWGIRPAVPSGPPTPRRALSASSPVSGRARPAPAPPPPRPFPPVRPPDARPHRRPQRPQRTSPARARCPSWASRNAGDPGDEGSREGRGPGPREPRPVAESESGVSLPRPLLGSCIHPPSPHPPVPRRQPPDPPSPHPPTPSVRVQCRERCKAGAWLPAGAVGFSLVREAGSGERTPCEVPWGVRARGAGRGGAGPG